MSWIREPRDDELTEAAAAARAADVAHRGYVPNYNRVFAHRPEAYAAWGSLAGAIKGSMGVRRYELATLAAALRLRSSYCSLAHGQVLADTVLDPATVRDAVRGEDAAALTDVDRAVMRLADRVAAGAADMTPDDLTELRELGLDDAEVLDVVLAAAARCFFSTVLDAVGAEPDAAFAGLDPALRDALTVGRPIAQR
ncbi:carboxymuconolactone decarboxylase family protein [Actinotalea ferrariae]|uniref:carboxymuconolactone decarboxylase family protein n=1 Tax=Actinotalea ferrariae TaxID=1386098 RepID=UPI001C8B33FD|nr:carboxymuconolactone decarboxylase family protein [Actinotalea ferrariae]MBX9244724.1 carboxymuconolactone decarboxylase family protein [Actinotalea ferrariae]